LKKTERVKFGLESASIYVPDYDKIVVMSEIKGPLLLVISAPSGGGKTTLTRELVRRNQYFVPSVSSTTRPPRPTEIPDQDYIFMDQEKFETLIADNAFAEWAEVHGHKYGTLKKTIDESLTQEKVLILTIDVQGATNIKKTYPDSMTVFVKPPDFDILETRLRKRGTENEEDIRRRLENARKEMTESKNFEHTVLNDRLERVALEIESLVKQKLKIS